MRDQASATKAPKADDDCEPGARNRFFRGKHMKAADFAAEQQYFLARRRQINRSVLGWGVVHGLAVTGGSPHPGAPGRPARSDESPYPPLEKATKQPNPKPIGVGDGLALDRHGRETGLASSVALDARNTFMVEEGASGCRVRSLDGLTPDRYVLAIHYAERRFGDAETTDACGCEDPEKKYVCETAVFSLRSTSDCPCVEERCERPCRCGDASHCDEAGRGPHSCLCEWVTSAAVATATPALCHWRGYWIDPADGVPLACLTVELGDDKCGPTLIGWVEDACGPRRLVKSNDLLYDLIRGCDLTRIAWISWAHWHRGPQQMKWDTFSGMFRDDGYTDFVVRFSGPVREDTLRSDVATMSAVTTEQATGWRIERRVPLTDPDLAPDPKHSDGQLPSGTTNQMRFKVRPEWVRDEIEWGRESWLSERNFRIEISIHGDFILDCHGQAVDANAVGLEPTPTGNGTPGGTFQSNFRVEQKKRDGAYDAA